MRKLVFSVAAVAAVLTAPLGAQIQAYTSAVLDNNGTPFWDNLSDDGSGGLKLDKCNVGFVLNKDAGTVTNPCSNQHPAGWLPYTGSVPTAYWGTAGGSWAGFLIGSGTFSFSLLPGTGSSGGSVAGDQTVQWGYFTFNSGGGRVLTRLDPGLPSPAVAITGPWGLWSNYSGSGGTAYSDLNPQFAAFFTSTSVIFGLEDINTVTGNGDKDFNDHLFQITASRGDITEVVPEPASMTLLATGLAGLAGAGLRRRRKQK